MRKIYVKVVPDTGPNATGEWRESGLTTDDIVAMATTSGTTIYDALSAHMPKGFHVVQYTSDRAWTTLPKGRA